MIVISRHTVLEPGTAAPADASPHMTVSTALLFKEVEGCKDSKESKEDALCYE